MSITIHPVSPALGAEVTGVDLSRRLGAEEFDEVHRALLDHGVVFLRDQDLEPRDLIDFAGRFGPLNVHPMMKPLDGHPAILEIAKNPEDRNNFGGSWHTDLSYLERPALASLLYAREIPPVGGDTLFASMYLAYEVLSEGLKGLLSELRAVHDTRRIYTPDAQHRSEGTIGDAASIRRSRPENQHGDRPSGGPHPPRDRPQGALRQLQLHLPLRGHDRSGERPAARLPLRPPAAAGVHLPVPVERGRGRAMGQPLHPALRPQRLPRTPPGDAPNLDRGGSPGIAGSTAWSGTCCISEAMPGLRTTGGWTCPVSPVGG